MTESFLIFNPVTTFRKYSTFSGVFLCTWDMKQWWSQGHKFFAHFDIQMANRYIRESCPVIIRIDSISAEKKVHRISETVN